jgi:plastocyanin
MRRTDRTRRPLAALPVLALLAMLLPGAGAAQTGVIQGRVTFGEEAPPPRRTASRYPGGAAPTHPIQSLPAVAYLVGPMASGAAPSAAPTMSQRDTAFVPAVVATRAGGAVSFPNADPFFHNVFSYSSAQRFDLGRYPQGESKDVAFPEAGIVEVFCEVHEFMRGAILVAENPYYAVVGADGRFSIAGVPDGQHTIAFWHPDHQRVEQRVVVTGGGTTRVEVELRR